VARLASSVVRASAAEVVTASSRRNLVILADSLVVGGAERVLQALAEDLPGEGFRVRVGCLRGAGPVGRELREAGIAVDEQIAPAPRNPVGMVPVARYLAERKADILYVLDHSNALWHGRLAGAWLQLPQVCAVHRTRRSDGSPSLGFADRLLGGLSRSVIAVSQGHGRYLCEHEGVAPNRVEVVYNGVDPARFETADPSARSRFGLPETGFLWGIVAALRPEKNHEMALRALDRAPGTSLVLIGDGPRANALRDLSRQLAVEDRVHWLGQVDDVPSLLPALDAVVLCSHPAVETFPVSLLEAMAAARPVVATRVGSLGEMVVEGENGYLVEPGDEDGLLDCLSILRDDPDRRSMMGAAGRELVSARFTRARMVAATARILDRHLGKTPGDRRT
jgi:glycosyltransferase involved in cell wall biosynthesis